jgi:iron-sulfur cluster insertion protein
MDIGEGRPEDTGRGGGDSSGPAPDVILTERAATRIAHLLAREENKDQMLRVAVFGGGCSGFQYSFAFDDRRNDDDTVIEKNGVTAVIDEVSMGLLAGSEIDYVDEMIGASFAIRNPNATSSCGCGNSFSSHSRRRGRVG